jgi:hypothetical protein
VTQPSVLASTVLFHLGLILITGPVVTTWAIMLVLSEEQGRRSVYGYGSRFKEFLN